jgi:hypothetical protein
MQVLADASEVLPQEISEAIKLRKQELPVYIPTVRNPIIRIKLRIRHANNPNCAQPVRNINCAQQLELAKKSKEKFGL